MAQYADLQVVLILEENGYVAHEPLTGTTTEGGTFEEARAKIIEALELYFEEVGERDVPDHTFTTGVHIRGAA